MFRRSFEIDRFFERKNNRKNIVLLFLFPFGGMKSYFESILIDFLVAAYITDCLKKA